MAQTPDGGFPSVELCLWKDNLVFGEYYGEDLGSYYRLTLTSQMLEAPEPREGYEFLGWEVNVPTSSYYTNPTGKLTVGDQIYSTYHDMYLTGIYTPIHNSRILFKTDTTQNWDSVENTFETMKGEMYFYNDAGDTNKTNHAGNKIYKQHLRIGDGTNKINKLAFWRNPYILTSEIDALFGTTSSTTNLLDTATLDSLVLG